MNKEEIVVERGLRLKQLRKCAKLTTAELAELSGVTRVSITYWENATKSGLHINGAEKIVNGLKKIGIDCDIGWLLQNSGIPPNILDNPIKSNLDNIINSRNNIFSDVNVENSFLHNSLKSLEEETKIFLNLNKNSIITKIEDNSMLPYFKYGNIVGGIWKPIESITEDFCILEHKNKFYVRKVKKTKNTLIITHINLKFQKNNIEKYEDVNKIAPILRLWVY